MKVLYYGKNKNGLFKASFDKTKLEKFSDVDDCQINEKMLHNNRLYMVVVYYGKYHKDSITQYTRPYTSVHSAKESFLWRWGLQNARSHQHYHISRFDITSDGMSSSLPEFKIINIQVV